MSRAACAVSEWYPPSTPERTGNSVLCIVGEVGIRLMKPKVCRRCLLITAHGGMGKDSPGSILLLRNASSVPGLEVNPLEDDSPVQIIPDQWVLQSG